MLFERHIRFRVCLFADWVPGKYGTAVMFNATNAHDYVTFSNDASFDLTDRATIIAWINPQFTIGPSSNEGWIFWNSNNLGDPGTPIIHHPAGDGRIRQRRPLHELAGHRAGALPREGEVGLTCISHRLPCIIPSDRPCLRC